MATQLLAQRPAFEKFGDDVGAEGHNPTALQREIKYCKTLLQGSQKLKSFNRLALL